MIRKFFKTLLLIILAVVLLFAALVLSFRFSRNADKDAQAERLERLQAGPETRFSIPDTLLDDALRLNQIRYLATHNSYHRQAGPLQLAVLDVVEPGEAAKLRYSHLDFYSQLDIGVRSFELDLRIYRSGKIENIHVPLVDNRGHSPVLRTALEEMLLWSERNPGHVPIIVIMEVKDDWRFLDPGLKKWSPESLIETDALIREIFGSRLISPDAVRGNRDSVREAVTAAGWPLLGDSRGRFIFVFHQSDAEYFNSEYFDDEERVCFYMDDPDSPEAAFILRNEPDSDDIEKLLDEGFIIRTRADADCECSEERKTTAIASGAQIISTEYPEGHPGCEGYSVSWKELLSATVY